MHDVLCPHCLAVIKKQEFCTICGLEVLLHGRYYLMKKLGQNIGVTYQALDTQTRNRVVVKELIIKSLKKWKDEELFRREADTLLTLDHKQIPDFIDFFSVTEGKKIKYYTVMEFIYGETLLARASKMNYTEFQVIEILKDLAQTLSYIHSFSPPLIHRDIKPANVVQRRKDGALVLIDFGAVTDALKPQGESTVAGTFGYMAPEQFVGKAVKASDFYSLGVLTLFLLTKKKPEELMDGIELHWENLGLSHDMEYLLSHLLNKNPKERVQSYAEILKLTEKKERATTGRALIKKDEEEYIKNCLNEFEAMCVFLGNHKEDLHQRNLSLVLTQAVLGLFALSPIFLNIYNDAKSLWMLVFTVLTLFIIPKHNRKSTAWFEAYIQGLNEKELVYLELLFSSVFSGEYKSDAFYLSSEKTKLKDLFIELHDNNSALYQELFYKLYAKRMEDKSLDAELMLKYTDLFKGEYKDLFSLEAILLKEHKGEL